MSDDDPKPALVIDVAPESDGKKPGTDPSHRGDGAESAEAAGRSAKRLARRSGGLALAVGILALIGVGTASLIGYRQLQTLNDRLGGIEARLGESRSERQALHAAIAEATRALGDQSGTLDEQQAVLARQRIAVDDARAAFEAQEQRLAAENQRLEAREAELRSAVADVYRRVGRSGTQWMIAETEYLLRIADHRLKLARDTRTALAAMELADQRLRDTRNPAWAGVREQIARDIAALSAFRPTDLAGLSARLGAVIEQVPSLQVTRATIGPERHPPQKEAREPGERSWETLPTDLWAGFKDAVRIREHDEPVTAMLAPEHEFFLYENLKLQLEIARLGLVLGDRALFRDHLETASGWVSAYFKADGVANTIGETLDALRTIDIRPPLPDISQSLHALRVRRQLLDDIVPPEDATAAQTETP